MKKEQDKYRRYLKDGKRKLVSDMSTREQRRTRKDWTKRQRISRASKRSEQLDSVSEFSLATASSGSTPNSSSLHGSISRQKAYGQKVKTRAKNKAYRRIQQLEEELAEAKRRADKYKKRSQRSQRSSKTWAANTPRTKTRKLMANFNKNKKEVKKVLVFHYALVDQIRRRYLDLSWKEKSRPLLVWSLVS